MKDVGQLTGSRHPLAFTSTLYIKLVLNLYWHASDVKEGCLICSFFCIYDQTILAKVFGNGGDLVICQAYGRVEVGVPSSVTLNVQSEQIGIGREMPIYPSLPKARSTNKQKKLNLI